MKAYFLPGLALTEKREVIGEMSLSLPLLDVPQLLSLSRRLLEAHEKLADTSIYDIVDWIDSAVRHWCDHNDPVRKRAEEILPKVCGLSKEMVRVVLDEFFSQLSAPSLLLLLKAELGDPKCLDSFSFNQFRPGLTRAFGPQLIAQIIPGNVLGVSVLSLVSALLVKSSNLLRVSREELMLAVLFAESLQEAWPEMAETMAILTWDKERDELTRAAFQKADLVIAYGSDESIAAIREKIPPTTKAIFHGHKLSFGIVSRESISDEVAAGLARDISLFDQRGCLSPHLYYVESGGAVSPLDFAARVAESLECLSSKLPKALCLASEATKIQQIRGSLPLRGGQVFCSAEGLDWTVLYDPDASFAASPLSRTIWIKPVADLQQIPALVHPVRHLIQAVGVAVSEERAEALVSSISKLGGCRICPIGEMQHPPLTWHHDGTHRLLPLLRFVDWEK